ncbi:MAG: phosphotransferase [bacterium]|nr:phosphotransferase [bacterium]
MTDYTVVLTPLIIKETKINDILGFLQQGEDEYFKTKVLNFEILRFEERPASQLFNIKVLLDSGSKNIFVKISKLRSNISIDDLQKEIAMEYEIGKMVSDHLYETNKYSAIKMIVCFPEYYALVTEECQGDLLNSIIIKHGKLYPNKQRCNYLKSICYNCGLLLKNIHDTTLQDEIFDLHELIEYIDIRLKKSVVDERIVFDEKMRQGILKYLRKQIPMISKDDLRVVGTHGDFGPNNILIENQTVKIMDYADFQYDSMYQDITYFYQRLENLMHNPIFRPVTIHALQDAFCQGYSSEIIINKPIFMMFRVRHVINNFRSILMGTIVPQGKQLPFYKKIFNEIICKKYIEWLSKVCKI